MINSSIALWGAVRVSCSCTSITETNSWAHMCTNLLFWPLCCFKSTHWRERKRRNQHVVCFPGFPLCCVGIQTWMSVAVFLWSENKKKCCNRSLDTKSKSHRIWWGYTMRKVTRPPAWVLTRRQALEWKREAMQQHFAFRKAYQSRCWI